LQRLQARRESLASANELTFPHLSRAAPPDPSHQELALILEIADIRIQPGQQAGFEDAIQRGIATVVTRAQGFMGFKVNHSVESPERYVLMIYWATLEDHTVAFRQGPLFPEWRAIVGPFFAAPPVVEHFTLVAKSA
jgi:heme-degrading monooxygenase HmoA